MVNLTVIGVALHGKKGGPLLLLHPYGTDSILALDIGPMEAFAVSAALHGGGGDERRPSVPEGAAPGEGDFASTPHDCALECIRALGGRLMTVDIRVEHGSYHAEATLLGKSGQVRVGCRPSDGIALALRCGAMLRADSQALAHTRDMSAVLDSLPAYLRVLAEVALAEEEKAPSTGAPGGFRGTPEQGPAVGKGRSKAVPQTDFPPSNIIKDIQETGTAKAGQPATGNRHPVIRVSLVRQDTKGKDVVEEIRLVPNTANNAKPPARLSGDAAEDERWFALLQALSPETKVPM